MHLDINVKLYSYCYSIFSQTGQAPKKSPKCTGVLVYAKLEITICNGRPGSIKILHARQEGVAFFYDIKNAIFHCFGMKIFRQKNLTK